MGKNLKCSLTAREYQTRCVNLAFARCKWTLKIFSQVFTYSARMLYYIWKRLHGNRPYFFYLYGIYFKIFMISLPFLNFSNEEFNMRNTEVSISTKNSSAALWNFKPQSTFFMMKFSAGMQMACFKLLLFLHFILIRN